MTKLEIAEARRTFTRLAEPRTGAVGHLVLDALEAAQRELDAAELLLHERTDTISRLADCVAELEAALRQVEEMSLDDRPIAASVPPEPPLSVPIPAPGLAGVKLTREEWETARERVSSSPRPPESLQERDECRKAEDIGDLPSMVLDAPSPAEANRIAALEVQLARVPSPIEPAWVTCPDCGDKAWR